MMPTLLHAVARKAEALTPDAELLSRFARDRDHSAFEELVRRHGPLVWAVCRQTLPDHADAEDAFQAVFLALVRSAPNIRDGRALPAWLHGVAVRVVMRAKRQFARRRDRDRAAAVPEADRSVSGAAWESLVAVVHEEVQRLPESERTAFVLCDLEGVSQPDAAARLGCPLGSVSGRLCKARQRLLERLAARGIAPAAVVGVGLTAGAAGAVPAQLFNAVKTFPAAPLSASGAVSALARGLTEGVAMRVKLTAAAVVVVAALGMTGGAALLSSADAQPPGGAAPGSGFGGLAGEPGGAPEGGVGQPGPGGAPGFPGGGPPGAGGPVGPGGMGGMGGGGHGAAWAFASGAWDYKFVDIKSDRKDFEKTITQNGKDGWEFCSSERFGQGELTLVFKKRKGGEFPFAGGGTGGAFGGPGRPWRGDVEVEIGGKNPFGAGVWGNWGGKDGVEVRSFALKNASAADVGAALTKALAKGTIKAAIPEPATNRILVVADAAAMKDVVKMVEELEARPGKGPGPGGLGAGNPGASGEGGRGAGVASGRAPFDPMGGLPPGFGSRAAGGLTVLTLKHATADEMGPLLKRVFPAIEITADARTNQLVVRADPKTLEDLQALLNKLDVPIPKSK